GLESMMVFAGGGREMGQPGGEQVTTLKLADAEAILRDIPEVSGTAPFNRLPGRTIKFQERAHTATIFGVTQDWSWVWDWGTAQGNFITRENEQRLERVCVIGKTVKQEVFGDANPIGEQIRIGNVLFEVIGVLESRGTSPGGGDMDNRILIPLTTFMRRIANVDYIAGIKIRLHSAENMEQTSASIQNLLRERHKLAPGEPDDFRIITPTEVTQFAGKVAGTFNIFLVLVAAISLIAGGFVIANIMLISVSERRGEIGLRKAIGARNQDIRFQFMIETIAVTLTGGIIGIVLGFSGAFGFRAITQIPVSVSWESVALGIVFSAVVGLIAGLQPAKRAAALQPIEALRG
ncbi:MAG: ABC transporter permease, partial [bacterium]|nr:ABC transporter permease [bacterium]